MSLYPVTCPHCRGLDVSYCGLCDGDGVVYEHPEHPLIPSQPVLEVRKLDGPRLGQDAGREPAHPVVVDAKGFGYLAMLPDSAFYRFSGLLNAFFYRHYLLTL